jgi:hypothetical protein
MQMTANENKTVNQLRDDIMGELHHEDIAVQIRVAFAVLVGVILDGSHRDPDEVRVSLVELQTMMKILS